MKRSSGRRGKVAKKRKIYDESTGSLSRNHCVGLRKDIWMEIIKFLDTKSFLTILPTINKFFYISVNDCKKHLYHLSINLKIEKNESTGGKEKIIHEKSIDLMLKAVSIEKLNLKINNKESIPSLINRSTLPQLLKTMPWSNTLRILHFEIIELNNVILKDFLNSLQNLEKVSLKFHYSYPSSIEYFIFRFINPQDKNNNTREIPFTPIKHLFIEYIKASASGIDIFDFLDRNKHIESFALNFNTRLPLEHSLSPHLNYNTNLKILELSPAFAFGYEEAKNFCMFLEKNKSLVKVKISETLLFSMPNHAIVTENANENGLRSGTFAKALELNTNLKSFELLSYLPDAGFTLSFPVFILVLQSVSNSSLKKFSIESSCFNFDYLQITTGSNEPAVNQSNMLFLIKSFQTLFRKTGSMKKFKLNLGDFPEYIKNAFRSFEPFTTINESPFFVLRSPYK